MAINLNGTTNTISPSSSSLKLNSISANEFINVMGNTGDNSVINLANGTFVTATVNSNPTFTIINVPSQAVSFTLVLTNDDTGGRTITWPASVRWPGGAISRTLNANKTDIYTFFTINSGTTWYGSLDKKNYS